MRLDELGFKNIPRVPLAFLPTPLMEAPRLAAIGGPRLWIKRDNLTGFGFGGNKIRGIVIFLHTGGEPALFVGEGSWLNE